MAQVPSSWPRGFPLEFVKDNRTVTAAFQRKQWPARRVGVFQSLADHDPDVDGIYRLTQPLPFTFPPATLRRAVASAAAASPAAATEGRRLALKRIADGVAGPGTDFEARAVPDGRAAREARQSSHSFASLLNARTLI